MNEFGQRLSDELSQPGELGEKTFHDVTAAASYEVIQTVLDLVRNGVAPAFTAPPSAVSFRWSAMEWRWRPL